MIPNRAYDILCRTHLLLVTDVRYLLLVTDVSQGVSRHCTQYLAVIAMNRLHHGADKHEAVTTDKSDRCTSGACRAWPRLRVYSIELTSVRH